MGWGWDKYLIYSVGMYGIIALANLVIGIVCNHTLPGPTNFAKNNPFSIIFFLIFDKL